MSGRSTNTNDLGIYSKLDLNTMQRFAVRTTILVTGECSPLLIAVAAFRDSIFDHGISERTLTASARLVIQRVEAILGRPLRF